MRARAQCVRHGVLACIATAILNAAAAACTPPPIFLSKVGEDGIIEAVFECLGTKDKFYVEFGTEACTECTTRYLREKKGWR